MHDSIVRNLQASASEAYLGRMIDKGSEHRVSHLFPLPGAFFPSGTVEFPLLESEDNTVRDFPKHYVLKLPNI
jgi:hypothetical protein